MGFPRLIPRRNPISFRPETIPESFIYFDSLAGIQAIQKKFFQFLSGSLEVGSSGNLNSGDGRVNGLFGGTIRTSVDDCPDSLFLVGSELYRHRATFR